MTRRIFVMMVLMLALAQPAWADETSPPRSSAGIGQGIAWSHKRQARKRRRIVRRRWIAPGRAAPHIGDGLAKAVEFVDDAV